jgi:hypothetical protein
MKDYSPGKKRDRIRYIVKNNMRIPKGNKPLMEINEPKKKSRKPAKKKK